jgi:microsomal dipeptidase-like Zn-dependent dipeptidase
MVAYLKQEGRDEASLKAAVSKADRLLDLIEERIGECGGKAALAITPEELWQNKFKGVKSVVRGIENGYAIGLDIDNVDRFRSRGVAYMTLCHNGDNDICDSHKGNHEHNGLSEFGKRVVERMNRVGMMVDLSHASEKSFWDALECSSKPIICSHSSSRALCDHTRNLTDEQMRALAESGGVAQVCMYGGFLNKKEEDATVNDAVRHIMHMIDVMGVDHVGIGSDFDGGGGIPGLEDASWFVSLTGRLMAQGLTDEQLSLLWGGNFLRVWRDNIGL